MTPVTERDKKLARRLAELKRHFADELREKLVECGTSAAHNSTELLDMVSDGEYDDISARIAEADTAKIRQIEEAFTMLREGRYGVCQRCGGKIQKRRLRAIPFATLCLGCKQVEERETSPSVGHHGARAMEESPVAFTLDEPEDVSQTLDDVYGDMEANTLY
jgi:DnaK suppressor protein